MNLHLRGIAAVIATLSAAYSAQSFAQDPAPGQDQVTGHSTYVTDSGRVVHCVSTESGRTYCGTAHVRYTISGTPPPACVYNRTWGFDDRGAWVSGGCVADFAPVEADNQPVEQSTYYDPSGNEVHCVAMASGRTYCGRPHVHYVIASNPSPACVEGNTWGVDDRGVWVSGGCNANFTTVTEDKPAERVYSADNDRVVHCVSTPSGRTWCGSAHTRYVIHGTADPACVEGKTWGVDDRGVWVTGGCNADFSVEEDH